MSWNRQNTGNYPSGKPGRGDASFGRRVRIHIATFLIVVAAVGIWVWRHGTGPAEAVSAEKSERARPAAETPRKVDAVQSRPKAQPVRPLHFWEVDAAHTNGFTEMQMRKWRKEHRPPPGFTNDAALVRKRASYAIFPHRSENQIAALLTLEPGQGIIGTLDLRGVQEDFLKSFETPIVVTEEDSPEDAALKELMKEVKEDLRQRIAEGENLADILHEVQGEYQQLARYKRVMEQTLNELKNGGITSEEDLDDALNAANEMLESRGIAPIQLGPIARKAFLRHVNDTETKE